MARVSGRLKIHSSMCDTLAVAVADSFIVAGAAPAIEGELHDIAPALGTMPAAAAVTAEVLQAQQAVL